MEDIVKTTIEAVVKCFNEYRTTGVMNHELLKEAYLKLAIEEDERIISHKPTEDIKFMQGQINSLNFNSADNE